MTIAVHITESDSGNNWLFRQMNCLSILHPDDTFYFIYDNPEMLRNQNYSNIKSQVLPPVIKNRLLRHFWYQYKLPGFLQRINPDLFICDDSVCMLKSPVKQVLLLHQPNYSGSKFSRKKSSAFGVQFLRKYVSAARLIICFEPSAQDRIQAVLPQKQLPVKCIHPGFDTEKIKFSLQQREAIKSTLSDGVEYFIMPVTPYTVSQVLLVVKAFSAFKKRQKSGMKLLLQVLNPNLLNQLPDFKNYKYRTDLIITEPDDKQMGQLQLSAAYASVYMPVHQLVEPSAFDALILKVPLICEESNVAQEYFSNSVIYCKPDEVAIAEKLMDLYRNEKYRNEMVQTASSFVEQNTAEQTARKLWEYLEETAEQVP